MKIKDIFFFFLFLVFTHGLLAQTPNTQTQTQAQTQGPLPNDPQVDAIINYAKRFLGVPYRYGGTTPSGFDCSGFINYIFGSFGFDLVRSSYGLAELGTTVLLSEIRPGDLMFFKGSNVNSTSVGHVALVVEVSPEAIKFIHSANSGVRIDNFKTSQYYIQRYIKTKRLDYGTP